MGSSALPLSLLAKGIGQVVTNGHEKLEVYLEPEDYYNLKSYSPYHVQTLQENESLLTVNGTAETKPLNLHKTFVTRKGALLIFSEELANKAIQEEQHRLNLKHQQQKLFEKQQWDDYGETSSKYEESEKGEDPLRTVHDLRVAILMYGNRPDYRKKGDDLYLRFIHESKAIKDERKIRPGFSPKRYITAWSKYWHEEMLQKLRTSGLVQDKTIYRQNPLLPHLYQPASYNLSAVPPPYRVTRNMLHAGDVGTYAYHKPHRTKLQAPEFIDEKGEKTPIRKEPPPSTDSKVVKKEVEKESIPLGSIQAVRFLESGEVQEVKYSELKPQEKKEILAELLQTAWEHGKHIEEMLDLVLAANKPRTQSAASSSQASELMMDMHRAILSLADSPIQRQIQQKQQALKIEQEKQKRKDEREAAKQERKRLRQKRREEREAQIAKEHEKEEVEKRHADQERQRRKQERRKQAEQRELINEAEQQRILQEEQEKQAEHDEREKRREARREARRKKEEERAARKREKEELARKQQEDEEQRILEEKQEREQRREERRRQREERRQRKEEEKEREARARPKKESSRHHEEIDQTNTEIHDQRKHSETSTRQYYDPHQSFCQPIEVPAHQATNGEGRQQQEEGVILHVDMVNQSETMLKSRQMPAVPNNTPATQQRVVGIQRQFPLENVIYEAKSKRSNASSSSTTSSTHSRKKVTRAPPGTLVSTGDGQFAHYSSAQPIPPVKPQKRARLRKLSPLQQQTMEPALSIHSGHSSKPNVFPAVLPGDTASSQGKSSFYGGAMPITSNIVKQTLSDKISILSASQDNSSVHQSDRSIHQPIIDQYDVPVIGVEPPTPVQPSKQPSQAVVLPSPVASASTKSTLKKASDKDSSLNYSNESEDEPYLSDHSSRSIPRSIRGDDKQQIASIKKSSTTVSGGTLASTRTSEAGYQAMKGMKGPGSQSSAATFSQKAGSKKSSSFTRGSLPNALLKRDQAAIYMPDQKIVEIDVNVKPDLLSSTEKSTTIKSSSESEFVPQPPKLTIKSSLKDVSQESSSVKSSRRVSFNEEETAEETTGDERKEEESKEEDQEEESEEESEASEETEKDDAWPEPTNADLRPISSRSAKLTEHAQKVAQIVIESQRTDSRLEEDATEAAKLWNAVAKSQESSSEAESEEESEEEDEESSAAWNANQVQEEVIVKQDDEKSSSHTEKTKAKKIDPKPSKQKEIVARRKTQAHPPPAVAASVKSYKSTSSGKTSISSVQEAFVKEVKRKASELGIDEAELQFDAQLVDKVYKSTIQPDEVEVFHDTEAGKHVVRSRHSSVTTKSVKTDTTETTTSEKKKFVIDMPTQEVPAHSVSPHHSVSTTSSTTMSPTSPRLTRALSQTSSVHSRKRKSSIPGKDEKDVSLGYELTSYEAKLGDPKPEEPVTVMNRPKLEPEKLVDTSGKSESQKAQKEAEKARKAKEDKLKTKGKTSKPTGSEVAESVSSDKDSIKSKQMADTRAQKKAGKKGKQEKEKSSKAGKKETDKLPVSPEKPRPKTPEVPFVAGRAKENKAPKGLQSPPHTPASVKRDRKTPGIGDAKEPKTQVELEGKLQKGKVSEAKIKSKSGKKDGRKEDAAVEETKSPDAKSPTKSERAKSETPLDDYDQLTPIPAESPEDDYAFVRVEETPEPSEPEIMEPVLEEKPDDEKSQVSNQTAPTETTDNTEDLLRAAEDDAENEAKLAKKKEKEEKRLAAAEKRRLDVERKRKEKEEQLKKEKEEQERQDQMREELENERRRRAEEMQRKREEMEKEKEREKQEEILRKRREEQQREREKRLQEEHKRKMEELQKKKKEEEEKKAELARIKAEEEEAARKEEEEMMAQMAEDERIKYEKRKRKEAELKKIEEEERRLREAEEVKIAMEQARLQAIIKAKQQAALEEKLKFAREFFIEANGLDQTQNVNRAFSFSYFELLQLLGLEFTAENMDL